MLMTRGWPDLWELFRKTLEQSMLMMPGWPADWKKPLEQIVWMIYDWPGQRNFPAKPWAKNS